MAKLAWDQPGQRFFESGVDHAVLYPNGSAGVPWNGIISIEEEVSGGETESHYYDGMKYFDSTANEDFSATLTAFTYPDEFAACDGTLELSEGLFFGQQPRETFGLAWRTKIGNDLDGIDHGHKIHILYDATAAPSTRSYQTFSDSPSPMNFSWSISAVPTIPGAERVNPDDDSSEWVWPEGVGMIGWPKGPDGNTPVPGWKATSYFMIETTDLDPNTLRVLEDTLFGSLTTDPMLPSQFDLVDILGTRQPNAEPIPNLTPIRTFQAYYPSDRIVGTDLHFGMPWNQGTGLTYKQRVVTRVDISDPDTVDVTLSTSATPLFAGLEANNTFWLPHLGTGIFVTVYSDGAVPKLRSYILNRETLEWTQGSDTTIPIPQLTWWSAYSPIGSRMFYGWVADDDGHIYVAHPNAAFTAYQQALCKMNSDGSFGAWTTANVGMADYKGGFATEPGRDSLPHHRIRTGYTVNAWSPVDVRTPMEDVTPVLLIPLTSNLSVSTSDRRLNSWYKPEHYLHLMELCDENGVTLRGISGNYRHVVVEGHIDPTTKLDVVDNYKELRATEDGWYVQSTFLASGIVASVWPRSDYVDGDWTFKGIYVQWDIFGDSPKTAFFAASIFADDPDGSEVWGNFGAVWSGSDDFDALIVRSNNIPMNNPAMCAVITLDDIVIHQTPYYD